MELANKIYSPSYISLDTILEKEGIIFQKYEVITVVSYLTRKIKVAGREIYYRKIKDTVLMNNFGVSRSDNYFAACKERAFLDAVFLYRDYHFDNISDLDWDKIRSWQGYYQNKNLENRVKEYCQIAKQK